MPDRERRCRWRLAGAALLAAMTAACAPAVPPSDDTWQPQAVLQPFSFAQLEGWGEDDHGAALGAFRLSCQVILRRARSAAPWLEACQDARAVAPGAERLFFERHFRPWLATAGGSAQGLFTGYYEPVLAGSRRAGGAFGYPLYRMPEGGEALPERAAIDAGALAGRGLELVWLADPVAAFFLHIQGSGAIALAEGGTMRVGFAGRNGHPYRAIGRDLVAQGALTADEVSLQTIRAWLHAHPDEAFATMAANPSYIFFRELEGPGPVGAQGVPLTAGRSLAIDDELLAYGLPVWLDTVLADGRRWRRLTVAQDTGAAIRGPIRGDIFFGSGEEAEGLAGGMKSQGRAWFLLPQAPTGQSTARLGP